MWADSGRPWDETSVGAAVVTGHGFSVPEKTHETATMQREACHREMCAQKLCNSWRISECCLEEEGKFHRKAVFKDQRRNCPR